MQSSALPLDIVNVGKKYLGKFVLKGATLQVNAGEIFGLIGLNGAGKTTLIKAILDLIRMEEGSISLFGRSSALPKSRENLAYLPEKFQPSRYLCGHEYLTLALSYYGKSFDMEAARAKVVELDLDPRVLEARVASYSKGMGQKLGLAGAFLIGAPLLILDEPMSGLDPRARILLKEELLRQRRSGCTVFFSSHILSDIDEICDRIGVIHEGDLFFTGAPEQFKQRYGSGYTLEQTFLRAINAPSNRQANSNAQST